jgi:hypothetical protein
VNTFGSVLPRFVLKLAWICVAAKVTAAVPSIRVAHSPDQPGSGQTVQIIASSAVPVSQVELQWQVVPPGKYIELKENAFRTDWTTIPMVFSTGEWKASIPGNVQKHRRLIRYRFKIIEANGKVTEFPSETNSRPNFAYFVYDGIPAWHGAIEPGSADLERARIHEFTPQILQHLPVYHLISKKSSVEASTWGEEYRGKDYKWSGTVVYEGKVYDHVHFRSRGGTWRYAMGKNMWKFEFNKGQDFEARDNFGRPYQVLWSKLNLGACIQQGQFGHRGEEGMFEAVGFKLFNLAGVEAPHTHWIHFRVIDEENESDPGNQYAGDFWGVYLAVEEMGGRFLREHQLPNGNLFKMEGGTGELKNTGSAGITNKSDLNRFLNAYNGSRLSDAWWKANLDLSRYYSYRSIIEAIHHYDVGEGKNYFYFLDPDSGRWSVHPWDLDLTWANNMYGSGDEPFRSRVLSRPAFQLEYQNRLRELRDLLLNTNEASRLIDEYAFLLTHGEPAGSSIVAADRARWDYHPAMTKSGNAGQGQFYRVSPTHDFAGMVQLMKVFIRKRSTWVDAILLRDPSVPPTPEITYAGDPQFARLTFSTSAYAGTNTFAAVQWRIANVTAATRSSGFGSTNRYEIVPLWQSPELPNPERRFAFPNIAITRGETYRVRARMRDATGRWSHWSRPFEFRPEN